MSELYRLVYTSRNLLQGSESDRAKAVAEILATSQANNSRIGVTGALLFNGGYFAQVLEGPRPVVESTFERIQRDPRHSDVSVLQCEPVVERGFLNWSMAFIGHSARGRAMWQEMASRTGFDLARIEGEQLFSTLHAIVLAEEGLVSEGQVTASATLQLPLRPELVQKTVEVLDVERLRAELRDQMPEERPAPLAAHHSSDVLAVLRSHEPLKSSSNTGSSIEASLLRAALAEERVRTTDLRRDFDEARIALALANEQVATLRRQRDVWASRAKMLASALCQDPDEEDASNHDHMKNVA